MPSTHTASLAFAVAGLLLCTAQAPEQAAPEGGPNVGDLAPDFTLKTLDGTAEVQLSSYRGECPVALVFGSYT